MMFLPKIYKTTSRFIVSNYEWICLLSIVILATSLRFFKIGEWGFWVDELLTLQNALNLPQNLQHNLGYALREHPVSSGLIYTAVSLSTVSEFNARMMIAILGICSIPLFYWLIKKQYNNTPIALLFALFLTVSPWHIYWSQNSRFYMTLLIFYWIALFSFYWGYERQKKWALSVSVLFMILAVSERLLGLLIIPVIVGYVGGNLLLNDRRIINIWQFILLGIIGLSVTIFFGSDFIQDPQLWFEIYGVSNAISPAKLFIRHLQAIDLHIFILGLLGFFFLYKENKKEALFWASAILFPLGVVIGFAFFQFTHPRYIFVTLPGWLLLAAIGAYQILNRLFQSRLHWGGLTAVLLIFMLQPITELQDYYTINHGGRLEWKSAFQYVNEQASQSDIIFTNDQVVGQYYLTEIPVYSMRMPNELAQSVMNCQTSQTAWFVLGGQGRTNYDFLKWVEGHASLLNYEADRMRLFMISPDFCH